MDVFVRQAFMLFPAHAAYQKKPLNSDFSLRESLVYL